MRILALNYEFPPLGGGAGNATAHICRELVRLGCCVEVLTAKFEDTPPREERDGYVVHRIRALRRRPDRSSPWEMASFAANAALPALSLARRFRPDILHVYFGVPTGPVGLLVKLAMGIPYILSLRGGDVPGFMPKTLGTLHRCIGPLNHCVWDAASAVVANSEGLRELAQGKMGVPVAFIPNGVDLSTFSPQVPRSTCSTSTGTAPATLRVLFAGRLVEEQKGVRFLLTAVSELREAAPITVEIAGAGPGEGRLRDLVHRMGLSSQVAFSGWVSREQMPARYARADVFVFPSLEEGMPNVVLEAMASGLPIVATDIYGHRGLVEHGTNGFLIAPANAGAIAEALINLCRDPKLRTRMGQASRARAEAFTWTATAQAYLNMSQAVLERSRRGEGGA